MKQSSEHLGIKIVVGLEQVTTPWSGVSLLIDLYRKLEIGELVDKVLPAKKSNIGLKSGQTLENFVLLNTLGGE